MESSIRIGFESPSPRTDEEFEDFLDCVLEELDNIGRDDIELTASLAKRTAVFTQFPTDEHSSLDAFTSAVRTALHAAHCATQGWGEVDAHLEANMSKLVDA